MGVEVGLGEKVEVGVLVLVGGESVCIGTDSVASSSSANTAPAAGLVHATRKNSAKLAKREMRAESMLARILPAGAFGCC